MRFQTENGVLIAQANGEILRIEPWGKDSLRVRATMLPEFSGKDWALTEVPEKTEAKAEQPLACGVPRKGMSLVYHTSIVLELMDVRMIDNANEYQNPGY